ncbi:hypothetical protein BGW42_007774 [Actinomortierella wolfii]|nr:hypothetical protein BGW42_007774 [Actinomortierella wolfii]
MKKMEISGTSTPTPVDQAREHVEDNALRTRTTCVSTPSIATPDSATNDTRSTFDSFLSRMLAKPGDSTVKPHPKRLPAESTHNTVKDREERVSVRSPSPSNSAAPSVSSPITLSKSTESTTGSSRASGATTSNKVVRSSSPSTGSEEKDNKRRDAKAKQKESITTSMEALRGARRKPLAETPTREQEATCSVSDGSDGRDGSVADASPGATGETMSLASTGLKQPSKEPSIIYVSSQPPKEPSIIYVSSQPSWPQEEGEQQHAYTIESTLPNDDSSLSLTNLEPAPTQKQLDNSLASNLPSVNRSFISHWIGDVVEETNLRQEEDEKRGNEDQDIVKGTQQPISQVASKVSNASLQTRAPLRPQHSVVIPSTPPLNQGDSSLPLPICTPTFNAAAQDTTNERAYRAQTSKPGVKVLVPDSLQPIPSWMNSLPEEEDYSPIKEDEGDQSVQRSYSPHPDDIGRFSPSTMEDRGFLQSQGEVVPATGDQILSALSTTQPGTEKFDDHDVDKQKEDQITLRYTTQSPPFDQGSSMEDFGVHHSLPDQPSSAVKHDQYEEDVEEEEEAHHLRKRAKRDDRTQELIHELEHPRRELPLDMSGAAQDSNYNIDESASLDMAQRNIFPSTLGSLPPSSSLSYQSTQDSLPSHLRQQDTFSRDSEAEICEENFISNASDINNGARTQQPVFDDHLAFTSSKSNESSSILSLASPPSIGSGESTSASYADELTAIAKQITDHK